METKASSGRLTSCCDLHRRQFLGVGAAVASMALVGVREGSAQEIATSEERRDDLSPDQVIEKIVAGNERYVEARLRDRDWLAERRATAGGQAPAVAFLSCIDSRVPIEVVTDLGIGDAFTVQIAGNVVNEDVLGSLEFATAAAGAKLIVVLGHSSCGAVEGSIAGERLGHLTVLLARFQNAIDDTDYDGERTVDNVEFVNLVAKNHVHKTVDLIRERSPVIRDLETDGEIKVIGAFYDLETGRIEIL